MELTEGKFNMCGWGFLASSFVEQPLLQYMAIASLICIVISHNPSLIFFVDAPHAFAYHPALYLHHFMMPQNFKNSSLFY